jgi:hypothetical protein
VDILVSSQDVFALGTEHREIVTIAAQDLGLILDPCRYIPLIEHPPLGDNGVG